MASLVYERENCLDDGVDTNETFSYLRPACLAIIGRTPPDYTQYDRKL